MYILEFILLKHDVHYPSLVRHPVYWQLSEENLASKGIDLEFPIKGVVLEEFRVFLVSDNTVFRRLGDWKIVAILGGFVVDHDDLDHRRAGPPFDTKDGTGNNGGEMMVFWSKGIRSDLMD